MRALAAAALALALGASPAPMHLQMDAQPQASFGDWTVHYNTVEFDAQSGDFVFPDPVTITRPGGDVRADRASGNLDTGMMNLTGDVVLHDTRKAPATTLTTDALAIDEHAKTYVATGHVRYTAGTTTATSQTGKLDDGVHRLDLDGAVRVVRGASTLTADHVTYDSESGTGHAIAKAGTMVFPATAPVRAKKGAPAPKSTPAPKGTPAPPDDWTVHYTVADFDTKSGAFSIPNAMTIDRGSGGDASADRANGNGKHKTASLYGHVVVHDVNGSFGSRIGASANGPSTLTTDRLDLNDASKRYKATGSVHYTHADTIADGQSAVLDEKAHLIKLDGDAHIVRPPKSLQADHVTYDTKSGAIHAESDPSRGVITIFPGGPGPSVAPAKVITVHNPFSKKPAPTPTP